jgi:hypothetical protein
MAIVASAIVSLPAALATSGATTVALAADSNPVDHASPMTAPYPVPTELGATGTAPHDTTLSPQIVHDAGNPAALAASLGPRADVPTGPLGIPGVVLRAYIKAEELLKAQQPNCHLPWWLLAGIGKIESGQAEGGEVDQQGNTLRPILGPELDGSNGYAQLPAILGGRWTGDTVWQRAVGPMQFLPSSWLEWGNNGNPNNVYDAAAAAGRYLCAGGRDLSDPAQQAAAVFSYNHSDTYVQIVLVWANAYRAGVTPLPETTVVPMGPVPTGTPVPGTPTTTTTPAGTTTTGTSTGGGSSSTGGGGSSTNQTSTVGPPPTSGTTTTTAPPTTTTTPTCPSPSPTTNPPSGSPSDPPPNPPGCPSPTTTTTTAAPSS